MRLLFPVLRPHHVWAPALHVIIVIIFPKPLPVLLSGNSTWNLLKSTMKPKTERFWWLLACKEAIFMTLKPSQDRDTLIEQSHLQ